jgi:hypothetical protein
LSAADTVSTQKEVSRDSSRLRENEMDSARRLERLDYIFKLLAFSIFIIFWLVVITFPSFFFFNPLEDPDLIRRIELTISTIGWVSLSTFVPITLFVFAEGLRKAKHLILFLALIYPLSLIASQITIYIRTGSPYLNYLVDFPIFIFTDIILPILVIFIWVDLKEKKTVEVLG